MDGWFMRGLHADGIPEFSMLEPNIEVCGDIGVIDTQDIEFIEYVGGIGVIAFDDVVIAFESGYNFWANILLVMLKNHLNNL